MRVITMPHYLLCGLRESPLPYNKEGFREEINIRFLSNPILGIQNLELDKDETFERRIKAISVVPA